VGFVVRKLEAHTRFARHRNHFLHGQKQIIRLASEVHSKQRSTIRDLFGDAHQLTLVGGGWGFFATSRFAAAPNPRCAKHLP
jgi:hypothetical protein